MAPAVTLQLTVIPIAVSPTAVKPTAVKFVVWLGSSVTLFGESCMRETEPGWLGPTIVVSAPMQAASAAAEARRTWRCICARRFDSLNVNGIDPLPHSGGSVARLAWHALACGSLGALRHRLSPVLPLSRSLSGGCDPAELQVLRLPKRKAARNSEPSRVAGGRADMATAGRRSPLALRHRLSAVLL